MSTGYLHFYLVVHELVNHEYIHIWYSSSNLQFIAFFTYSHIVFMHCIALQLSHGSMSLGLWIVALGQTIAVNSFERTPQGTTAPIAKARRGNYAPREKYLMRSVAVDANGRSDIHMRHARFPASL